jgi:hypothetical protein
VQRQFAVLALSAYFVSYETSATRLVRSEITLGGRTAAVAFEPGLRIGDAPVQVARFESDSPVHLGTLALTANPERTHCELWFERTGAGWQLQVAGIGKVPLSHDATAAISPTFAAALIPIDHERARLVFDWAAGRWTTEIRFDGDAGEQSVRTNKDDDPEATLKAIARAQRLNERNQTTIAFSDGTRVSVLYWKGVTVDGRDFASLASTPDGAVVRLTAGAVTRLQTERVLRFGKVTVRTSNLAPGYPGAYGVWLKRAGPHWRLVFNNEADAWGTQHDPAFDRAEIDLTYSRRETLSYRPFAVALIPTGADRGQLVIHWGVHEWAAEFVLP